jgi:hypothetical protein
MPVIERKIRTGEPVQVGDFEVTPQTRVLKIQLPSYHSGLIWNRPKAVIIRTADGQERTLPVRDVTRMVIWAMLAGGLLGAMLIRMMNRKN